MLFLFSIGITWAAAQEANHSAPYKESVYLISDRDVYVTGEKALVKGFIKTYPNADTTTQPSKFIHLALVGTDKKIKNTNHIKVSGDSGNGRISIPDTIPTGTYLLLGYTSWMKNFNPQYMFRKHIYVVNKFGKTRETIKQSSPLPKLSFHPEGGLWASGVNGNMGIRISNTPSKNRYKGIITNNADSLVVDTFSIENQFAIASFTPKKGAKYKLSLYDEVGKIKGYSLPSANDNWSLKVLDSTDYYRVIIASNEPVSGNMNPSINLKISQYGKTVLEKAAPITNNEIVLSLPKKQLPAGLLNLETKLLPFDQNLHTRLLFKHSDKLYSNNFTVNESRAPSTQVSLPLSHTYKNHATNSTLVSIKKSGWKFPGDLNPLFNNYFDLQTHLPYNTSLIRLLNNNQYHLLHEYLITQPTYWYSSEGSRNAKQRYALENNGLVLHASLKSKKTKEPIKNEKVSLFVQDSVVHYDYAISDSLGNLYFLLPEVYGNKPLLFVNKAFEDSINLYLDENSWTKSIDLPYLAHIDAWFATKDLSEIVKKYKVTEIYGNSNAGYTSKSSPSVNYPYYGTPEEITRPSDYEVLDDFNEISRNILKNVRYKTEENDTNVYVFERKMEWYMQTPGYLLLNSLPVDNPGAIHKLNSASIEKVEVTNRLRYYGNETFYGVVNIHTKKEFQLKGAVNSAYRKKFNHQFLSPQYHFKKENSEVSSNSPDFGQLLYWNPTFDTGKEDKLLLTTGDEKGSFSIEAYGFTSDGEPFYIEDSILIKD